MPSDCPAESNLHRICSGTRERFVTTAHILPNAPRFPLSLQPDS